MSTAVVAQKFDRSRIHPSDHTVVIEDVGRRIDLGERLSEIAAEGRWFDDSVHPQRNSTTTMASVAALGLPGARPRGPRGSDMALLLVREPRHLPECTLG